MPFYCIIWYKIAGYRSQLFINLKGKASKGLEIGIGTSPNLKYHISGNAVFVFGVNPNTKMEKYAWAAALAAGLLKEKFKFVQVVGESLPLDDASADAVVATLVLCSVTDVDMALKGI
ncbi:Methyltransferase type 11 [Dillenia turbinata]|uniref:Methyltransferase type 11 n=1 Tax=Dillenia turbinata TaxID=194707 RepID=A0AAN8VBR7_9MAGN